MNRTHPGEFRPTQSTSDKTCFCGLNTSPGFTTASKSLRSILLADVVSAQMSDFVIFKTILNACSDLERERGLNYKVCPAGSTEIKRNPAQYLQVVTGIKHFVQVFMFRNHQCWYLPQNSRINQALVWMHSYKNGFNVHTVCNEPPAHRCRTVNNCFLYVSQ